MARLQILELPEGSNDDRPPFILVVDEWDVDTLETNTMLTEYWDAFGKKIGARGVLFADRTIDIPANDTSGYLRDDARKDVTVHVGDQPIAWSQTDETQAQIAETLKPRRDWCCSLAFQTFGKQHIDDCRQDSTQS